MIKLVIFDMAGTTINEDNIVYKCVTKALVHQGISVELETVLAIAAGKEKMQALKDVYSVCVGHEPNQDTISNMYKHFELLLNEAYAIMQIKAFDDVPMVLSYLKRKKIKIAFNTGYREETARKILQKTGIEEGKDINLLITADMVDKSRPAPDMILYALEKFKIKPKECMKIGDSTTDILEGKNAGLAFSLGITTGAHSFEQLESENPDKIFHRLLEIIPFVEEINTSL